MFEIRIYGRGGQGVVTAAELLSVAAFDQRHHAQAFPSFGSERTGAPVVSFCRIDDQPIRLRDPIVCPDAVIIIDPPLLHQVDVFAGLRSSAYVLINSSRDLRSLRLEELLSRVDPTRIVTVAATDWRASTSAGRCLTRRCSARLRHRPRWCQSVRWRARSVRGLRGPWALPTSRPQNARGRSSAHGSPAPSPR